MIIDANGVALYVEDHGEGTPVLLIHGWPDSAHLWRHQIPFLTGHGFRAIAPDMRGSGGPAARPRWPTTRWPTRWATWPAYSTRSASRLRMWSGMTGAPPSHGSPPCSSPTGSRSRRAVGRAPACAADAPAGRDGLVPAVLPVRGHRGGDPPVQGLGLAAPVQPRRRGTRNATSKTCPGPARSPRR